MEQCTGCGPWETGAGDWGYHPQHAALTNNVSWSGMCDSGEEPGDCISTSGCNNLYSFTLATNSGYSASKWDHYNTGTGYVCVVEGSWTEGRLWIGHGQVTGCGEEGWLYWRVHSGLGCSGDIHASGWLDYGCTPCDYTE